MILAEPDRKKAHVIAELARQSGKTAADVRGRLQEQELYEVDSTPFDELLTLYAGRTAEETADDMLRGSVGAWVLDDDPRKAPFQRNLGTRLAGQYGRRSLGEGCDKGDEMRTTTDVLASAEILAAQIDEARELAGRLPDDLEVAQLVEALREEAEGLAPTVA